MNKTARANQRSINKWRKAYPLILSHHPHTPHTVLQQLQMVPLASNKKKIARFPFTGSSGREALRRLRVSFEVPERKVEAAQLSVALEYFSAQ